MAETTKISWTGATWNVARGCSKVSEGCKNCYMYRDSLDNTRYDAKRVVRTKTVFDNPLKWKEPKLIFTSSLTDVFHEDIFPFIHEVFRIIYLCRNRHIFQMLTKRPENIIPALKKAYERACELGSDNSDYLNLAVWLEEWLTGNPPSCVWLGVSIESDAYIERGMLLRRIPAHIRFISFEPMLDEITPDRLLLNYVHDCANGGMCYSASRVCSVCVRPPVEELPPIDWVIIGGESGHNEGHGIFEPEVVKYWSGRIEFPFPEISNCAGCFHHRVEQLNRQFYSPLNRGKMEWYAREEERTGKLFGKTYSYRQIQKMAPQLAIDFNSQWTSCDSGGCTD